MEELEVLRNLIERHQGESFNLQSISVIGDKVFLLNSGQYLLQRREVERILLACKTYLNQYDEDVVPVYNAWLLEKRRRERQTVPAMKVKKKPETIVYLMHNKRNGLYKIGRSKDPQYREKTLQAEEPDVELIHSMPGTHLTEKALHEEFARKRVRGEWFLLLPSDVEFIKSYQGR